MPFAHQRSFLKFWNACTDGQMLPNFIITDVRTYEYYKPYLGRKGPVTFTGTPKDVVRKLLRYQKGLKP